MTDTGARVSVERFRSDVDLLALHAANPERYPYLLESAASGRGARWDILFAFPQQTIRAEEGDFLGSLDHNWLQGAESQDIDESLPFRGGWFLFLDYELVHQIEPILSRNKEQPPPSHAYATRIPAAMLRDHASDQLYLIGEGGDQYLTRMRADLEHLQPPPVAEEEIRFERIDEEPPQQFLSGVERIKRYIVEGDLFQVNLSRQWDGALAAPAAPHQIYRRLRRANPAPFSGLAVQGGEAIISSSPERLIQVIGGVAETRPIAGTHPRGASSQEDEELSAQLLSHPKEQAEHIMLIDLERNDLGRVCQPGTIEVNELMVLESYAHVHHIVSNVRGELRSGVTPGEVIRALFPGGTITGCPKVRCMEIIDELEMEPRGGYTGSFGYLNHNGEMDLNILIRTITQRGERISLRAGAGIVHDSIPERELEETRAKAKGMLMALGVAS